MKRKILSFVLVMCLIVPFAFMLSACGVNNNGGGMGQGSGSGGNGGENNTTSAYTEYFNNVKLVEKMNFEDMSEGSPAYVFTNSVVEQIKSLSKEILIRLCGDFGDGLSVATALSYGIVIEEDIMPEGYELTYGAGCFEVIHYDNWEWLHVASLDRLPMPCTQTQYIDCYLEAYAPEEKENYLDKLTIELFKLLSDTTPQNAEQNTLLECAKNFDHTGFLDSEIDKITEFILNYIIGSRNVYIDNYNSQFGSYSGYRNYTGKVEAIVEKSVDKMIEGVPAYPVKLATQFSEKTIENFDADMLNNNLSSSEAKPYRSIILNTKKALDINSFKIIFEVPQSETTNPVTIDITGKYQFYNSNTSSYETIRAKFGTIIVNTGDYNKTTNANDFVVDLKNPSTGNEFCETHNLNSLNLGIFTNNTPLEANEIYQYGSNELPNYDNYFKPYEKTNRINIEYEDNTTPFFQLFFEINGEDKDVNFKFSFKDIVIAE